MKFGLAAGMGGSTSLQTLLDDCQIAEELGFDLVSVAHTPNWEGYFPPLAALLAIASKTQRVALATDVLILPLYHPIHLAADSAMVDVASGGRLILGVGGGDGFAFESFGVSPAERASRLEECVPLLRRLWSGEPVTHHGRHFNVEGYRLFPASLQRPGPPIWVGATVPSAVRRAARLGDAYVAGATTAFDHLQDRLNVYRSALRERGVDPATREYPMKRFLFVTESPKVKGEAERLLAPRFERDYAVWGEMFITQSEVSRFESLKRDRVIMGSPEQCVEELHRYADLGITYLITVMRYPGLSDAAVRTSMKLFMERVAPHFGQEHHAGHLTAT